MRLGIPALLLTACGAAEVPFRPPDVPVQRSLPAGTVLRVQPAELVREGELNLAFLDGLMRVALGQSVRFDVAAAHEGAPVGADLAVQADPQARILTTTLHETGQGPIPLAQASYETGGLPAAVDVLALASRQALGEVPAAPRPSALAYSGQERCVEQTERALTLLLGGDLASAEQLLIAARRVDGGSPVVLDAVAGLLAVTGRTADAMATASEGLRYQQRLAPTISHRLARTLLQAGASLEAPRAEQRQDRELLLLADATLRERPHDVQVRYSRALALNFLSRFEDSAPLLTRLHERMPYNATVAYHLAFAALANRDYEQALAAIRSAEGKLPPQVTAQPIALALYHTDRQEELSRFLEGLAARASSPDDVARHEVLRMQAAHAVLTGRREDAIRTLVEDLEWMRQRPSMLERLSLDLVENGEVLFRLGATLELRRMLVGLQQLNHLSPTFAQGMVYLGGLLEVVETGGRATAAEASLTLEEKQVWGNALRAMGFRERGELLEEATALALAAQNSDSALIRASLALAWRAMGRVEEAEVILAELRVKLLTIRLRLPLSHPLLNPARALAFLAVQ